MGCNESSNSPPSERDADRFPSGFVEEQETLARLRQIHPGVDLADNWIQQFAQMRRSRTGEHLDAWLVQTKSRNLPELQFFACGREKDKDAVRNGLTWSINNEMVEGFVTKVKLIKRQGFGRASFPLRGLRVLYALYELEPPRKRSSHFFQARGQLLSPHLLFPSTPARTSVTTPYTLVGKKSCLNEEKGVR
jgi:Transposase